MSIHKIDLPRLDSLSFPFQVIILRTKTLMCIMFTAYITAIIMSGDNDDY